jgi:hypothetical protein
MCALAAVLVATAAGHATVPTPLRFRVFADTGLRLTDVVWTGSRFLYVENTTNSVWAAGPTGAPVRAFASMPNEVEETRCVVSPGAHGFPPHDLFCHAPDNTIYRINADGSSVAVFARLPDSSVSDGAIVFDTVGRFGYALLAATGRSGAAEPAGGGVYAVDPSGAVRPVGRYPGPGGADEAAVAPARFGSAGGQLVLPIDAGNKGTIVLMDGKGRTRTIASLPDGPNPIVIVSARPQHTRATIPAGLYVTDTNSHDVFFAPASQLVRFAGDVVVGSELKALFWVVRPRGRGFQTLQVPAAVPGGSFNLEAATYVAG